MNRSIHFLRGASTTVLLTVAVTATGCFNPFDPRRLDGGISTPPPVPNSPGNALRLLEWCYNNRAIAEYRELFSDDYRFTFSGLDQYGDAYRDTPWTREDEVISTTKLFQGGDANQPPATSIVLTLDRNFRISIDPRPGKDPKWHKTIRTSVLLDLQYSGGGADKVTGFANFFLVRGDSALIPEELVRRGFAPDSNRWYIERWEDDTAQLPSLLAPPLEESALVPAPAGSFRSEAVLAPRGSDDPPSTARPPATGAGVSGPPRFASWGQVKLVYR